MLNDTGRRRYRTLKRSRKRGPCRPMPSSIAKSIPLKSEWPTYISTSVIVHAPREKVWDVLVDFASYGKWNPYIHEGTLLDASSKPLPDAQITEAKCFVLKVCLPPGMDDSLKTRALTEVVMHVEPRSQLAWGSARSRWLFGAEHWNVLSDAEGGGTKFEIIKVYSGVGPALMMGLMRETVTQAITEMAAALKARCEELDGR
ncbi:hypothetical protein C8R44DRAFT_992030 [Mycena epipterygia]|nr:hypothetical protein C8R44DRAFT_992030 [Mycena epipterygia]